VNGLDTEKVKALSQFLIGLAILHRTNTTFVTREIHVVKEMIEAEIGKTKN
jgi:hypothetical protein